LEGVPVAEFVQMLAAGALSLAVALAAQPAPAAAQPEALAPAACAVEPRPDDEVAGLVPGPHEPLPDAATPAAGGQEDGLVDRFQGEPADPETAAEVGNALAQYAGCLNANDRPRLLALLTDRFAAEVWAAWDARATSGATPAAGSGAPPLLVAAQFEGWDAPELTIASVRGRDILLLPDGRAVATVAWRFSGGDDTFRKTELVVLDRAGDRWLVDYASGGWLVEGEVIIVPEDDAPPSAGAAAPSDEEILARARTGFNEVDSAAYAEPTMAGAEFAVAATLMVGFQNADDYEGVGCEFIVI
jgi:hypothetical protein